MTDQLDISPFPGQGPGILQPILKHRFEIHFNQRDFKDDATSFLKQQLVSFNLNAVDNTIAVQFEHPAYLAAEFFELISNLALNETSVISLYADQGLSGLTELAKFKCCKCIFHEFSLGYSESGTATHDLTFKYNAHSLFSV